MKSKLVGVLAITISLLATAANADETLIWKTETTFAKELGPLGECKPDDEECLQADHVGYASISHYGRTYYLTYEEASRAYVSFDASLDNDPQAQLIFALGQIAPGAFDWGGIMDGGQFKPLYVIKRFYDPEFDWSDDVDPAKSGLFVWRLSEAPGKGRSEMIGMAGVENAKARKLAETDFAALQNLKK